MCTCVRPHTLVGAQDCERKELNSKLHEAAERGDVEGIERWIKAGAQVNARGPGLWSALHMAARYGHAEAAERLVQNGAHLEQRSSSHFTPLHHAAMRGQTEVLVTLGKLGGDLLARTPTGETVMQWAERNGHVHTMLAIHRLLRTPSTHGADGVWGQHRGHTTSHDLARGATERPHRAGSSGRMRRFDSQGRCVEDRAITDQLRQREAALAARDSPWLRLRSEESLGRTGRRRPATWAPVLRAPAPLFQTHAPADLPAQAPAETCAGTRPDALPPDDERLADARASPDTHGSPETAQDMHHVRRSFGAEARREGEGGGGWADREESEAEEGDDGRWSVTCLPCTPPPHYTP